MSLAQVVHHMSTDQNFAAQWRIDPEGTVAQRGLRLSKEEMAFLKAGRRDDALQEVFLRDQEKLLDAFDPEWSGAVPYTVLISPEGKFLYAEVGGIEPLEVKRGIVKALNERKPW